MKSHRVACRSACVALAMVCAALTSAQDAHVPPAAAKPEVAQSIDRTGPFHQGTKGVADGDRRYWAFQPVRRPTGPAVRRSDWPAQPLDVFLLAKLDEKSIEPNPPATARELIRRAFFDLTGLPPTPDEMETWLARLTASRRRARLPESDDTADTNPTTEDAHASGLRLNDEAYAALIDSLLARPQYGERWARHWLDVVRYAQTNGYERDGEKPNAWRYRDYVIKAFNEDKPYDRFIIEQLAGDELDDATDDSIIATGFYRLGVWDDEPDDAQMAEFDALDDVMVATGSAFLGLTLGCARCHDHKFDPIPHEDYYRLLAFCRNVQPYADPQTTDDSPTFLPLGDRVAAAKRFDEARAKTKPLEEQLAQASDDKEKKRLQDEIAKIKRDAGSGLEWALAVRDGEGKPTRVFVRGNAATPGTEVDPAFLTALGGGLPTIATPRQSGSTGRRLALANWIASPDNPLTARVMANRIWQHHFGRGIVKTTSDFGRAGTAPTHPQLLDWLAAEFISGGWSIKHLQKVIMLSRVYQQSSKIAEFRLPIGDLGSDNQKSQIANRNSVDAANDLFWRQNLRRLEAEAIRDSILTVSGQLNTATGGRGFFPYTAGEVLAAGSRPGDGWATSPRPEQQRRSIYTYLKRSMVPPFFEGFDYSNTASALGERPVTTVAPQALMMLNDQFLQEQAIAFAARARREAGDDASRQVERAYRLALGRSPTPPETQVALAHLDRQTRAFQSLASRLTFVPDVPVSLHRGFMSGLRPDEFMIGPREGWLYYRGRWGNDYSGITALDPRRTPFALWQGASFVDAVVESQLTLQKGTEFGAVIVRATAEGDVFRGYEVVFDPRERSVAVRRHDKDVTVLKQVSAAVAPSQPLPVRIEATGPRLRVWLAAGNGGPQPNEPVLDVTDPEPVLAAGRVGATSWGAGLSLDRLAVETDGKRITVPDPVSDARQRALASLCLAIFNLNEFVYVD